MVESAVGPVPEGWDVKPFAEAAEFVNGYAFKPSDWGKHGTPIIKIKELKEGVTDQTPRFSGDHVPEKYRIENGDLLFSWSADLDAYVWPMGDGWLNQHLFVVIPREGISRELMFYAFKVQMHEFRSRSAGTTMRHIKRSALDQVKMTIPSELIRGQFDDHVRPMLEQVQVLQTENTNLRGTRDLLLPRLISGDVDVSELEITGVVALRGEMAEVKA